MIQFGIVVAMSLVAYEDFKFRAVRVVLYPILFGLLVSQKFTIPLSEVWLVSTVVNICYILLVLLVAYSFFCLKARKIVNPFMLLGLGDLLFFFLIAVWFDPIAFVVFNTVTFVISAIVHALSRIFKLYSNSSRIPLAGVQSLCFIFVFVFHFFTK